MSKAVIGERARRERVKSRQGHLPPAPAGTGFDAADPQVNVQVAPTAHEREQELVQVMAHVEPAAQLMLPLSATVTLHVAFDAHSTLHDLPHAPLQVAESAHLIEQLSTFWQLPKLQRVPLGHVQLVPVQLAGGSATPVVELLLQAAVAPKARQTRSRVLRVMGG